MKSKNIYQYKSGLIILVLITSFVVGIAQPQLPPGNYSSSIVTNYVKTFDPLTPQDNAGDLPNKDYSDVRQTTQFFDGLGRLFQVVVKKGSMQTNANPVDMVNTVLYDANGRTTRQYLPFPANNALGNMSIDDGIFKLNPFPQQISFYNAQLNGQTGEVNISTDKLNWAYSKTDFEASPLGRVNKVYAPGTNWVGGDHGVENKYWINTAKDSVLVWKTTVATTYGNFSTYAITDMYAPGQLNKMVLIDEHGNQVIEFTDKEGKVILKKVQLSATNDNGQGSGHTGWLCTYYIYDDLNLLRAVIQPRGVELLQNNLSWNVLNGGEEFLAEQFFRYEYDPRNRMIMKKVPGAGAVYMVYDSRDRLALSQDANLRLLNKWMVTLYDQLNRPIQTGLWVSANSLSSHLLAAYSAVDYPFSSTNTPTSGWEMLSRSGYDNYTSLPSESGLNPTFDNSWNSFFIQSSNVSPDYAQSPVSSNNTNGLVTWTQTKLLDFVPVIYQYSLTIYDSEGRPIQVKSKNYMDSIDISTTQYNWRGQPLIMVQKLGKGLAKPQRTVLVTKMNYDALTRLSTIQKRISNTNVNANALSAYKTVLENEYDYLGQLKAKKLGESQTVGTPLASLQYQYNIRGWMLSINKDYLLDGSGANINNSYFAMSLGYDKKDIGGNIVYAQEQFNGNINGTVWKSEGDKEIRKYDFQYDRVSRLSGADFNQFTGSSFNKTALVDFSVSGLKYDANGNIKAMTQKGLKFGGSQTIDGLDYSYVNYLGTEYSNKLIKVSDNIVDPNTKLGDFKDGINTGDDYQYDVNGNLIADQNKNISLIKYNHLNLPTEITVPGKGTIAYAYDASGIKLAKIVVEGTRRDTTLYHQNAIYVDDTLQFISHEEGRIRFKVKDNSFQYDYMLKDHLGNVRMLLTEEREQVTYPAATLEYDQNNPNYLTQSAASIEQNYYKIDGNNIKANTEALGLQNVPNNYKKNHNGNPPYNNNPYSDTAAISQKVYRLKGGDVNAKMGLGITLRVMAGDEVNIFAKSYWKTAEETGVPGNPLSIPILDVLNNFVGSNAAAFTKGITGTMLNDIQIIPFAITNLLGQQSQTNTRPQAYINWILFDDQFKPVIQGKNSSFSQVGSEGVLTDHRNSTGGILTTDKITKNGYLYVYCSNESQVDVFFDNLQVIHNRGPILEETHYYPFGLTMAGISSKALNGSPENKYKFNKGSEFQNKEFSDGSGLELYATPLRTLDPQIGRWHQIDSKPDYAQSLYSSMGNNPILYNDPLGDTTIPGAGFWKNLVGGVKDGGLETAGFVRGLGTTQGWKNLGNGLLDMADRVNPISPTGISKNIETGNAAANYVSNIPNMSKDQIGHDLGYGIEKTVEVVAVSKGVGIVKNAVNTARSAELGNTIGTLREASQGISDFSLGESTAKTSNNIGKIWAGEGAKVASDGKTLVSADKLKQYRPPSAKSSPYAPTGVQSNFQSRLSTSTGFTSNGHLNITPSKPFWQLW